MCDIYFDINFSVFASFTFKNMTMEAVTGE